MTSPETSSKPTRFFGSIRSQLLLGFGLLLFLALAIALIGYQSLKALQTSVQTTLDEARRIRELSLEIETEYLQARQAEASFMATWRSLGVETAQASYVTVNKSRMEQARNKLDEINILVQNSSDKELQIILEDTTNLAPLLDTYETAFQAVVTDIEQRGQPDGQESMMFTTLNQLESIASKLPNPSILQLVFQIQANEQSYLNTGQQQYYDNLRLLILELRDLIEDGTQLNLIKEPLPTSVPNIDQLERAGIINGSESIQPEDILQIPISELLELIGIYQENLTELVALEGDIEVNTIIIREVTVEINEITGKILQSGDAGFTRSRNQLQTVSNQSSLALIVVSVIVLTLGLLAAFLLARRIIDPLIQLSNTAQKLGQGDLTQSAQIAGGREFITLANSFNKMAAQLRDLVGGLETRVAERTAELEDSSAQIQKRASQLEVIAEVASSIASLTDVNQLLPYITQTVSDRFGFYHTGIFLISQDKEHAVLRAANSKGGQAMLARNHKLRIGLEGVVGFAASQKRAHIALDVGKDAIYFNNPDLPATRSEIALPLLVGEEVIGVLDVQSEEPNAFSDEDISVLTTLANQVAVAIENTRLFQQSQEALNELNATFRQYISSEWRQVTEQSQVIGYRAHASGLERITENQNNNSSNPENASAKKIPVTLRGAMLGTLNIDMGNRSNEYSEEEMNLVQTVADRLALALESARLLEVSQKTAAKEQTIGEITGKIGGSINLRNVLQTAVEELGRAIPGSEVIIELTPQTDSEVQ